MRRKVGYLRRRLNKLHCGLHTRFVAGGDKDSFETPSRLVLALSDESVFAGLKAGKFVTAISGGCGARLNACSFVPHDHRCAVEGRRMQVSEPAGDRSDQGLRGREPTQAQGHQESGYRQRTFETTLNPCHRDTRSRQIKGKQEYTFTFHPALAAGADDTELSQSELANDSKPEPVNWKDGMADLSSHAPVRSLAAWFGGLSSCFPRSQNRDLGHPALVQIRAVKIQELVENSDLWHEAVSSGAKARVDFAAFTARLKSCPDTKPEFSNKILES
jgi:hypothetical protein